MGDRLLEGRAPQGLVARLAPPFDGEIVEARLCEMARDRLRLPLGLNKRLRRAPVQRLPAALQEAVVGRVLNQRMLKAVDRLRRDALYEEKVRLQETVQSRSQRGIISPS